MICCTCLQKQTTSQSR